MSIMLFANYDSTDAAEFAATRLRRSPCNVKVTGISKRKYDDGEDGDYRLFAFPYGPMTGPTAGFTPSYSNAAPFGVMMGFPDRDRNFEPAQRDDVTLRVEAPDRESAEQAELILRSTGGMEIRGAQRV